MYHILTKFGQNVRHTLMNQSVSGFCDIRNSFLGASQCTKLTEKDCIVKLTIDFIRNRGISEKPNICTL